MGRFCCPGNIWQHLETLVVLTQGVRCYWHLVGGGQGYCSTPHKVQGDPPPRRIIRPQMPIVLWLRNPAWRSGMGNKLVSRLVSNVAINCCGWRMVWMGKRSNSNSILLNQSVHLPIKHVVLSTICMALLSTNKTDGLCPCRVYGKLQKKVIKHTIIQMCYLILIVTMPQTKTMGWHKNVFFRENKLL